LVADAAARVTIRGVDELANGVLAITADAGRHALGDRRQLAADDQAAVVVAGDVRLDDDVTGPALQLRTGERGPNRLLRAEVQMDAATVVAVERLDDAREAQPSRRGDRPVGRNDDLRLRDGQARGVEQPVRQALVRGDVDRDRRRPRRHRRPAPLLLDALAQLEPRLAI